MESLGLSDTSATWSDNPVYAEIMPPGRHEEAPPLPPVLADWEPQEFGRRLEGRNFRWSILLVSLLVIAGLAAVGYWLYEQPTINADAALTSATSAAIALDDELATLEEFGDSLGTGAELDTEDLFAVDNAARSLFDASGAIVDASSPVRVATAGAASAALDGVRLAGDSHAYVVAVSPLLVAPEFETDPNLIELDEAARVFGEWQLTFDEVRTALPDGVLSAVTEQLDILSGDLGSILSSYVDALRNDDAPGAQNVVESLAVRLDTVAVSLTNEVAEIQDRIVQRITEARTSLGSVLGP